MNYHPPRDIVSDRLRIIFLLLMVVDHTLHGYAHYWGQYWFVHDSERDVLYDVLYLHNNNIIIPMLFLISGQFVAQGVQKYGLVRFIWRRFVQLVIPAILGVILLVPIMSYGKFVMRGAGGLGFIDFCIQLFFTGKTLQGGPMWVLWVLFIHSTIAALILTASRGRLQAWVQNTMPMVMSKTPWKPLLIVSSLCILFLGFSDLRWGTPWWIGGWKVFYVQGSRFLVHALFFYIGFLRGLVPISVRDRVMEELLPHVKWLMLALLIVGTIYITYCIGWIDNGAYSDDIFRYFQSGGTWQDIWPLIAQNGPGVWIRTTLQGIFLPLQVGVYSLLVFRYRHRNWNFVDRWAPLGLGLFLFHPIFVIWMQIGFSDSNMPAFIKILLIVPIALLGSYLCSVVLKPVFDRVVKYS